MLSAPQHATIKHLRHICRWWFGLDTVENITSKLIFLIKPPEPVPVLTAHANFPISVHTLIRSSVKSATFSLMSGQLSASVGLWRLTMPRSTSHDFLEGVMRQPDLWGTTGNNHHVTKVTVSNRAELHVFSREVILSICFCYTLPSLETVTLKVCVLRGNNQSIRIFPRI